MDHAAGVETVNGENAFEEGSDATPYEDVNRMDEDDKGDQSVESDQDADDRNQLFDSNTNIPNANTTTTQDAYLGCIPAARYKL